MCTIIVLGKILAAIGYSFGIAFIPMIALSLATGDLVISEPSKNA